MSQHRNYTNFKVGVPPPDLDELVAALAVQGQGVRLGQLPHGEKVGPLLLGGAEDVAQVGLAEAGCYTGQRALRDILEEEEGVLVMN
jgi:hypothetical protein